MSYTLKTHQISVKNPTTGQYSGVDILAEQTEQGLIAELQAEGTAQVNRIGQAAVDVQAAVDQAESDAAEIISSTQASINTLEAQKNTIAQTVASMAELGTDVTLSTPGMAADAAVVGELNRQLSDETTGLDTKAPVILETASGAIASFDDGADSMPIRKIVATIEPQQAAGTPSPENPLSISGWTGANIKNAPNNLFDWLEAGQKYTPALVDTENKTIAWDSSRNTTLTDGLIKFKENTRYTLILSIKRDSATYAGEWGLNCRIDYTNGTTSNISYTITADQVGLFVPIAVVSAANKTIKQVRTINNGGRTYLEYEKSGIFEGVLTADDFVPYTGTTLPIAFTDPSTGDPLTVYGGTVTLNEDGSADVVSNRIKNILNGSEEWALVNGGFYYDRLPIPGYDLLSQDDWICNKYLVSSAITNSSQVESKPDKRIFNQNSGTGLPPINLRRVWVKDSAYSSEAEFKAALSVEPIEIVLTLLTPETYHFDSIGQLKTFLGTNNVWCDTGDVEVTYPADTKLFIEKLTQPTEDDMTADHAISAGTFFQLGNTLYLATAAIAAGATITPGTNATKLSLADALNQLNT